MTDKSAVQKLSIKFTDDFYATPNSRILKVGELNEESSLITNITGFLRRINLILTMGNPDLTHVELRHAIKSGCPLHL